MDKRRKRKRADALGRATEKGASRLLLEGELTKLGRKIHGSGASDGFMKIENHARDIRPRSQLGRINFLRRRRESNFQQRLRCLWISPVFCEVLVE